MHSFFTDFYFGRLSFFYHKKSPFHRSMDGKRTVYAVLPPFFTDFLRNTAPIALLHQCQKVPAITGRPVGANKKLLPTAKTPRPSSTAPLFLLAPKWRLSMPKKTAVYSSFHCLFQGYDFYGSLVRILHYEC